MAKNTEVVVFDPKTHYMTKNGDIIKKPFPNWQPKKFNYKSREELRLAIEDYFNTAIVDVPRRSDAKRTDDKKLRIYTMSGLARHLGFKTRKSLIEYSKTDDFSDLIFAAILTIEEFLEIRIHGQNAAGAIFALKNVKDRWSDSVKSDVTITVDPFIGMMKAKKNNDGK